MLKKHIFLFLLLVSLPLTILFSQNPQLEELMKNIDGEDREEVLENITWLKEHFEDSGLIKFHHSQLKNVDKEEEEFLDEDNLPEFMDSIRAEMYYDEYFPTVVFTQFYYPDKTTLQIKGQDYDLKIPTYPTYILKKIWYHDGSVEDTMTRWKNSGVIDASQKVVDSVLVTAHYEYIAGYETHRVKDKIEIEGRSIEIIQMKDNKLLVLIPDRETNLQAIIALNDDDRPLSALRGYTDCYSREYYSKIAKSYVKALEKVEKKARRAKSVEELKELFRKAVSPLPPFRSENDEDNMFIYTGYYQGNVASVMLYFLPEQNKIAKEREFILKNSNRIPPVLVKFDEETEMYGLMNPYGEEFLPPVYPEFFQINDFYYAMGNNDLEYLYRSSPFSLYYLDMEKKELVELPDIEYYFKMTADCIAIQKEGKSALWNQECREVTDYIYDDISPMYGTQLFEVRIDECYGLINADGETVLPVTCKRINSLRSGVAVIEDMEKGYMLINEDGAVIVSLAEYSDIGVPSEGLLSVKKEDKYGFLDIMTGEVVLPFIYEAVHTAFSPEGIAAVAVDGLWGLIDRNGTFVVPSSSAHLSLGSFLVDWEYQIGDVFYDKYGRVMEVEE